MEDSGTVTDGSGDILQPRCPSSRDRFVSGMVAFYYTDNAAVQGDAELQAWVMDIFTNDFLVQTSSGTTP